MYKSNNEYIAQAHTGIFSSKKASFSDWQRNCQEILADYRSRKSARQAEIDGMADTWAPRVIDERRAKYDLLNKAEAAEAKAEMLKNLEGIIAEKEKKLSAAMCSPGTGAVETLSLLSMRSNLTPGDIIAVLPQVENSLLGLQTLRDIAVKNGVDFPRLPSVEEINAAIQKIRNFAEPMIDSMDAEEHGYMQRLFWTTDMPGLIKEQFDFLDNPSFLQIDAKGITAAIQPKVEAARESQEGKASSPDICSKVRLKGSESIWAIADQFHVTRQQIQELNPTADLDNLYENKEIFVPSTQFKFEPGNPSRVQQNQVTLAETPKFIIPSGPNGEEPGDDISVL